jgi:hypothetical protein
MGSTNNEEMVEKIKKIKNKNQARKISPQRINLIRIMRNEMGMPLRKVARRLRTSYQTVKIYSEHDSFADYHEDLARSNGFKSASDYQNHLAVEKGYDSYHDMRVSKLEEKGYDTYLEYKNEMAQKAGFKSWADYLWHWKRS